MWMWCTRYVIGTSAAHYHMAKKKCHNNDIDMIVYSTYLANIQRQEGQGLHRLILHLVLYLT